jgi:CRP/FNR family transcriptional regulator, cyclic AMP receptor protein
MPRGIPKAVIEMLQAVPLFSDCTKKELREIAGLGSPVSVPDGKVLTTQGAPGYEFFLVLKGKARCEIDGAVVAHFGPGDYFGEMALLEHGPRHATVTAEGPVEVVVLAATEFNGLLDTSPSITRKLLTTLARREGANAQIHS